ncbi:MAG: phosphotransferase family protein [Rhodospirillaceae bacterium]|nr:phosphotransferase family protein [Rhodospirillaceae bacterium]
METEFFAPEHQQPQDWHKLATHLAGLGHRFSAEPPPRQFTGGFGNLNFLIEIDGRQAVLRRPPVGPLPPGGNDMGREYRVLSRLWRKFPLAPRGLVFCDDAAVLGAPFFVMEYRPGLVIRDEVPAALVPKARELSERLVGILADFHAVDPKAVDLDTLGNPEGFLKRAVEGWTKRCAVASADVYPEKGMHPAARAIAEWLAQQTPPEGGVSLLHNDYKLNNIIWDSQAAAGGPLAPVALLDWDMCTRGDPLFDLATLVSYWIHPADPPSMHEMGQMPTARSPGWLTRAEVVELYAKKTGRDVSAFHFYRVLTAFKLYIIFLQIYARYCRGTTTDPRIKALGPTADGLVEFAHEIMLGRAF